MCPNLPYADQVDTLRDLFGAASVTVEPDQLIIDGARLPIRDGVIVLLDEARWPARIRRKPLGQPAAHVGDFAPDIQSTFGAEWQAFPRILPEHRHEFEQYFDLIDLDDWRHNRVLDLGCGIGRWSHFLKDRVRELVLVDFSEAIFVARQNLKDAPNALFFLGDITQLPFRRDCADAVVCLGVLHHLPMDALTAVRRLSGLAPRLLIYLYSALDRRPAFQRLLLRPVSVIRLIVSRFPNPSLRSAFTWLVAMSVYVPLIALGHLLRPFGLAPHVPLHEFYRNKSGTRIRQDVYDRFFTRIEQRVSRQQILTLRDTFARVAISENIPQWHFLCERAEP